MAVLTGSPEDPFIRLDPPFMTSLDPADHAAAGALAPTTERIPDAAPQHVLVPADLFVLDNHRGVDGRTAFTPRSDGADLWLQKAFVPTSVRRMLVCSRDCRVVEPLGWNAILSGK